MHRKRSFSFGNRLSHYEKLKNCYVGNKLGVRRFWGERQRRDVLQNIKYSFAWIILWYVVIVMIVGIEYIRRTRHTRVRRVYFLYIKKYVSLVFSGYSSTIRGSSEFGRDSSIPCYLCKYTQARCIYNMYTRYTRFRVCVRMCMYRYVQNRQNVRHI